MAVSPDGRYVVTVNAGYGTFESQYDQSFAVLDTATGTLADFPDARTCSHAHQTLYSGLAFSRDGSHIYASMASLTDAKGDGKDDVGSGIAVYTFCRRKDRARAPDSSACRAAPAGTKDATARGNRQSTKECRIQQRLRSLARPATRSCWLPRISPTTLFSSTSRRARSRSASTSPRATPCLRPIPLPSPSRAMASARLLRCGMLRRSLSWTWCAARWRESLRCSSRPAPLLRERTHVRLFFRPARRRFMSRSPIAMPSPP